MNNNIFQCRSIGEVIKKLIENKKQTTSNYSLSSLAATLGLKGHSSLSEVVNNKRPFPKKRLPSLQKEFNLTKNEHNFIALLNDLHSETSQEVKSEIIEKINRIISPWHNEYHPVSSEKLCGNAIYSFIFAALQLPNARISAEWLKKAIPKLFSKNEFEEALQDLLRAKIIQTNDDGTIHFQFDQIMSSTYLPKEVIHQQAQQILEIALTKFKAKKFNSNRHLHVGVSYTIQESEYQNFTDEIRRFIVELINRYEKKAPAQNDTAHHLILLDMPLDD